MLSMLPRRFFSSSGRTSENLIRLNKLIATSSKQCSRREADRFLVKGWVRVDGLSPEQTHPGVKVPENTSFELLPPALDEISSAVSLVLNKPLGIVSSQPEGESQTPAIRLLTAANHYKHKHAKRRRYEGFPANPFRLTKLVTAGRLDVNSTGLLLFTQSGRLARKVIGADSEMEKEYLVRVLDEKQASSGVILPATTYDGDAPRFLLDDKGSGIIQKRIQRLRKGIHCQGEFLEAVSVKVQNKDQLNITLRRGKNHHIRRMCEDVGWRVQALKRVRIGPIRLQDLPVGSWRYLTNDERNIILSEPDRSERRRKK